jgi:ribonuclease BN (tRNA processing enzyme)
MNVILGGIRGSWPIAGRDTARYGGDSTSILVEGAAGERVLLDLGTGVRRLGERLRRARARDVLVLMTHYHLDHVIGLPSLPPLYDAACRIEFASPRCRGRTVNRVLPRLLADPFWPLELHAMQARMRFTSLASDGLARPVRRGGLEIRWTAVHHHAGCTAYRLDEPATGASVVLATDVEWPRSTRPERERLRRLVSHPSPAGALLFDGHFTPAEYPHYVGWGHSTWRDAIDVARAGGAGRLLIIHHAPEHDDRALARIDAAVRGAWRGASVARQGQSLRLGRTP